MPTLRDERKSFLDFFDYKADRLSQWWGVITDISGNQTGTGSPWADRGLRLVWYMKNGATAPAQIRCVLIADPQVGLGVQCGFLEGAVEPEILNDDRSLRDTDVGNNTWVGTSPGSLQPGGRTVVWADSRVLAPLATWTRNALTISVVSGYYPYAATRKLYAGIIDYNLASHQPGAGLKRFVGIYLDSSNTIQAVNGSTISTAVNALPPEPSWPVGAFRLSIVQLNDTQTTIRFGALGDSENDIYDRRMAWSDENGGGGWPFDYILTVSSTNLQADYPTITEAITQAGVLAARTLIVLDSETITEVVDINVNNTGLACFSPNSAIITQTANNTTTVTISANNCTIYNLRVTNSGAGTTSNCVKITGSDATIDRCILVKSSNATNSNGIKIEAGTDHIVRDTSVSVPTGTNRYGILADTGNSSTVIFGGNINGATMSVRTNFAGAVIRLLYPVLSNNAYQVTLGAITGWYFDVNYNLITVNTSGMSGGVWREATGGLRIKEVDLATAITNAATGDTIHLYPGTYSGAITVDESIAIIGSSPNEVILTHNDTTTVTVTAANVTIANVTINNTDASGTVPVVVVSEDGLTLDNVVINKTTGANATSIGLSIGAGNTLGTILRDSKIRVSQGSLLKWATYLHTAACKLTIENSELNGDTRDIYIDHASATVKLILPRLLGGNIEVNTPGIVDGVWLDSYSVRHDIVAGAMVMNGAFYHWQEGTSFATAANGANTADGWVYNKVGVGVHTVARDASIPTVAQSFTQAPYSILVDCTTIDATIAAGDLYAIGHRVMGFDFAVVAGRPFSFPFWVQATKTGVYCVAFRNSGADRSFVAEYTINAADTWEFKYLTIPASPSAGTWDYTNGVGLNVTWGLAIGSTFQTTAGSWQTGNFLGTANQVNAVDNVANNFRLALVCQPSLDEEAEFSRCQKRHWKTYDRATAPGTATGNGSIITQTRVAIAATTAGTLRFGARWPSMRAVPTVTLYSSDGTANAVRNVTAATNRTGATANSTGDAGLPQISIDNTSANAIALDDIFLYHISAKAQL